MESFAAALMGVVSSANYVHRTRGRKTHDRLRSQAFQNVVQYALSAPGENFLLPGFSMIALNDSHAAQRFG